MVSRTRKLALGGVAGTIIVSLISILGPELFSTWWNSDRERAESATRQSHLEAIREQTEVISNLRDAISALQGEKPTEMHSVDVSRELRQPPVEEQPDVHEDIAARSSLQEEKRTEEQSSATDGDSPASRAETPLPPPAIASNADRDASATALSEPLPKFGDIIGVFEDEPFTLCGHEEFRARIRSDSEGERLLLSSRNRSVPGAGFRGYENSLVLEQAFELWEGCLVAAAVGSSPGGRRIFISVGGQ